LYVYFYSLHVSGNCVPIIRRNNCVSATLVFVTLCGLPSGMQDAYQTVIRTVTNTSVALIQLFLLMMGT